MLPISQKILRGFDQVKQFASEKMGTAEETSEFPLAYQELDQKVDQVKTFFDNLLRLNRQLLHADDYEMAITESFMNVVDKAQHRFQSFSGRQGSVAVEQHIGNTTTIQEATANVCYAGADILSSRNNTSRESLASNGKAAETLQKYAQVQQRLGEARHDFSLALEAKFMHPFATYLGAYEQTNKARRRAQMARLELDTAKSKMHKNNGNEVATLETAFIQACDEAIKEMHNFIQYAESTHCIEMLLDAQLTYHRRAVEILHHH